MESSHNALYTYLVLNATCMLSSVHYLSFVCDLFFPKMQPSPSSVNGEPILQFETTSIFKHCHHTLCDLSQPHTKDKIIGELMLFLFEPYYVLATLTDWQPRPL